MSLQRTFTLDFVKQEYSTSGVVTRQGEKGEVIIFRPYAGGSRMPLNNTDKATLKGITSDNKFVEITGKVTDGKNSQMSFVLSQDWNSASGNFQIAYVELVQSGDTVKTTTVNIDWFVLPEASPTEYDKAHYIDELQAIIDELHEKGEQYLEDLHNQMAQAEADIANINNHINQTQTEVNNKINQINGDLAEAEKNINDRLDAIRAEMQSILDELANGDFYTKAEADERFMKKGEAPTDIGQAYKLTADDGTSLTLPEGVTSFTALAKHAGYFYVTRDQAMQMEDQGALPILFQNAGLFVFMPVGAAENAYRYQEIRLNVNSAVPSIAYRNTNGTSATDWVVMANAKDVSDLNTKIEDVKNHKYMWKGYFDEGANVTNLRDKSRMRWGKLVFTEDMVQNINTTDNPFDLSDTLYIKANREVMFYIEGQVRLQGDGNGAKTSRYVYCHLRVNQDKGETSGTTYHVGTASDTTALQWKHIECFRRIIHMQAGDYMAFSLDLEANKNVLQGNIQTFTIQELPLQPLKTQKQSGQKDMNNSKKPL